MKQTIASILALALFGLASPAQAKTQLRVDAGYTIYNMGAFKDNKANFAKKQKDAGAKILKDMEAHGAIYAKLGVDFVLMESWTLGPEFGYILGSESDLTTENVGATDTENHSLQYNPSLIPFMLRAGWQTPGQEAGWYYGGGLGLGFGLASLEYKSGFMLQGTVNAEGRLQNQYTGMVPIVDLQARGGYRWGAFGLGAKLGYRYAYLAEPKSSAAYSFNGVEVLGAGEPLKDEAGNPLAVDLGGLEAGVEFSFSFGSAGSPAPAAASPAAATATPAPAATAPTAAPAPATPAAAESAAPSTPAKEEKK